MPPSTRSAMKIIGPTGDRRHPHRARDLRRRDRLGRHRTNQPLVKEVMQHFPIGDRNGGKLIKKVIALFNKLTPKKK